MTAKNLTNDVIRQTLLEAIMVDSANGKTSIGAERVMGIAASNLGIPHNSPLRLNLLTHWNELIRGGLLGFGTDNGRWSTDACIVTESGKKTLENVSRDPANPAGYLAYLDAEVGLPAIARGYVEEALNTYNACCYKATAVMIGAAVEALVLDLRDTLVTHLKAKSIPVPKDLGVWQAKTVLEMIAKTILPELTNHAKREKGNEDLRRLLEDAGYRLEPLA